MNSYEKQLSLSEKRTKEHNIWRNDIYLQLPSIAMRVFAIRNLYYYGCGFHYELEKTLGKIISFINDKEHIIEQYNIVIEKEIFNSFIKTLEAAEFSAANNGVPTMSTLANIAYD